jgi:iron(III) transport system ATP-binding protein
VSALVVSDVHAAIAGTAILRGVSCSLNSGEFGVIVGQSGCGKSTLLRAIAGLLRPDIGTIALANRTLAGDHCWLPPERRRIGWVPQAATLFPHLTVAENIAFGRRARGWVRRSRSRSRTAEVVRELLDLTGLAALANRYPDQLSGGQAQRVALARALAVRPSLLLLDEPFGALDPELRNELRRELRILLAQLGVTALLVTHDQAEAMLIADTVMVMKAGRIEQQGAPQVVYSAPATAWVAGFLGEAVFLAGIAEGDSALTAIGRVPLSSWSTGQVSVLVRPEQFELCAQSESAWLASVDGVGYGGHDALIQLKPAITRGAAITQGAALTQGTPLTRGKPLPPGLSATQGLVARVPAHRIPLVGSVVGVRLVGCGVAYAVPTADR